MLKYEIFTNLLQSIGQEDDVSNKIYELSEEFVCTLYGHKEDRDVQYEMYCAKRGKCEANQLPRYKSPSRKYVQRANYVLDMERGFDTNRKYTKSCHARMKSWR